MHYLMPICVEIYRYLLAICHWTLHHQFDSAAFMHAGFDKSWQICKNIEKYELASACSSK